MASISCVTASKDLRDEYADLTNLFFLRVACRSRVCDNLPRMLRFEQAFRKICGPLRSKGYEEEDIVALMEMHLEDLETSPPTRDGPLFDNVKLLANRLGLSPVEQEILAFRVMVRTYAPLEDTLQGLGALSETRLARVLAIALDIEPGDIERALDSDSPLLNSGLMGMEQTLQPFLEKLSLAPGLPNALLSRQESLEDLFRFAVSKAGPPTLCMGDYPHLHDEMALVCRYLQAAMANRLHGVNILLYGPPGVGKTQLVRAIAHRLELTLYEVSASGWAGEPIMREQRYSAYRINQRLLAREKNVLILFDEVEDALRNLPTYESLNGVQRGHGKAWINRLLEENPVPTFWVTNTLDLIDPAILRRFDYVLEVRNPPQSVRRRILEASLNGLMLPAGWLERQAQDEKLTPAFTDRAAKVLHTAGVTDPAHVAKHFERIVRNQLEARGDSVGARYPHPRDYNLEFVNASQDLRILCDSLAKRPKGRILLHGPPGSGKTAFAHHLAQAVDRPLILKRASDIISMWVGQTEKNMARMFRDAAADDAVLLLDEADSFLQDRRDAMRSWEITQVNELLTQMECFEGLFLCATNFRENLDSAAMRRFGLKIKFDYLSAGQSWQMFVRTLAELGTDGLPSSDEARIKRELSALSNLAPGDFAAAKQCLDLVGGDAPVDGLLKTLQAECRLKPDGCRTPIGFA